MMSINYPIIHNFPFTSCINSSREFLVRTYAPAHVRITNKIHTRIAFIFDPYICMLRNCVFRVFSNSTIVEHSCVPHIHLVMCAYMHTHICVYLHVAFFCVKNWEGIASAGLVVQTYACMHGVLIY